VVVAEENTTEKLAQLERKVEVLERENERLRRLLEEALRAGKRQAAPFSRQEPKADPQKPGRKAGKQYGCRYRRPLPEHVDEIIEVLLPACCPRCGGRRGGLCQALARVASKAEPTYHALVEEIRSSPSVTPDETGWRVDGKLWWMWAFSTSQATVYSIQPGRGFEQAALVLGADFAGFLVPDGWGIYRQFIYAVHQTCLSHLLRRCREMILVGCQGRSETRPLGRRKTRPDECVGDGDLQGGWRLERRPAVRFADCV
jgi:hypothetical protein